MALARLLVSQPDVLCLDEPTNHLDADTVAWLERFLQEYEGTVLAITHDRYFLDNVASWILEVDRAKLHPFKVCCSLIDRVTTVLGYVRRIHACDLKLARTRPGRRQLTGNWNGFKPNQKVARPNRRPASPSNKALTCSYEDLVSNSGRGAYTPGTIIIPPGPRLPKTSVLECSNLKKKVGDRELLKGFNFRLLPGTIVGIIGPNGAGKSTLLRILCGEEEPDSGDVVRHTGYDGRH